MNKKKVANEKSFEKRSKGIILKSLLANPFNGIF